MRINIYAEELTDRVEMVTKSPDNHPGVSFYGVRMYLDSPDSLHKTATDDDSSAITIWVPWTKANGHDVERVRGVLNDMLMALDDEFGVGGDD